MERGEGGGGGARARGIRHASPPHDSKKQRMGWDWVSGRQEEEHGHHHHHLHRLWSSRSKSPRDGGGVQQVQPVNFLSPAGDNLTRELPKHDEHRIHYSDVRREFIKEQYPKYSGNNQDNFTQESLTRACRRDAAIRRSSSIEKEQYPKYSDVSREFVKEQYPKYSVNNQSDFAHKTITSASRRDAAIKRSSSIEKEQYPKYSDVSREFVKEQYPKYSVNNQRDFAHRTITSASRRDEEIRRLSSIEKEQYPKYFDVSREFVKEQYPKYSINSQDNFTQKLINTASRRDEIRRSSSIEAARCSSVADLDEFRRPLTMLDRKYTPFHYTDREDGHIIQGHNSSFASSLAASASATNAGSGNKVIGMDPELHNQNKDTQFAGRSVEGKVLDTCGMLEQRSIVLKDGTVQTFFTLPPTSSDHPLSKPKTYSTNDAIGSKTGILYSDGNSAFGPPPDPVGTLHCQDPQFTNSKNSDELHCSRSSLGQAVDEEEKDMKEMNYSRSAAYNKGLVQSKNSALDINSSRLSRGALLPGHRDSLQASSEDFRSGKLHNVSIHERHRQRGSYINENDLVVNTQNLSTEALQPGLGRRFHGSPSRGKALASYTENAWRERLESTFVSRDLNTNGRHSPYQDSAHSSRRGAPSQYGSLVRSYIDDLRPDRMEDTGDLRSHSRGDKNDHPMESDPADRYGNMCRTSSPRPISSDLHGESFKSKRGYLSDVLRREASRNNLTRHDRKERPYRREISDMDHMGKSRNSLQEATTGPRRSKLSPLSRSHLSIREPDLHGNVGRVLKRKYSDEDNYRGDIERVLLKDQDKSRKLREMDFDKNNWRDGERTPMHRTYVGRSCNDKSLRRVSDSRLHPIGKSFHMPGRLPESKIYQAKISGQSKWKNQDWHYDNDPSRNTKEEHNFHRPYKSQKSSVQCDEQGISLNRHCAKDDELSCDNEPSQQPDLAEDSDTFKQQVQKAFLRFSKVLNETPWQQKQYEEQGKAGSLLCIVCSSRFPKDFVDTHRLVRHTFNSKKVGFRAEHLGLHKALCVLMGWSHVVPPDNAKVYQSLPSPDARAMKEDLILWPPLVIVHNANGEMKKDGSEHVISNLDMDEILQGFVFSNGKRKVVNGSNANQGTLVVKFSPTFSGLQEAERLHKYCEDNHCGRNDWLQVQSLHKSQQNISKDSDLLQADGNAKDKKKPFYGYIGIAGDLEEVDFDTRKRTLVKSRKDIEAITDGPVHGA